MDKSKRQTGKIGQVIDWLEHIYQTAVAWSTFDMVRHWWRHLVYVAVHSIDANPLHNITEPGVWLV